jgi:hypothetical protein
MNQIDPGDNIAKLHRKRAKLRAKGDLRGMSRTEQLLRRQSGSPFISPISSDPVTACNRSNTMLTLGDPPAPSRSTYPYRGQDLAPDAHLARQAFPNDQPLVAPSPAHSDAQVVPTRLPLREAEGDGHRRELLWDHRARGG